MSIESIHTLFLAKERFLLLIHHSPDGDAIASSLALGMALKSIGKEVDIVCADPIPPTFLFLPSVQKIKRDFLIGDYNVIVTLDCGDGRRTGFNTRIREIAAKKLLVNIDHHPKNDLHSLAAYNFVDYNAPSTTYLVYQLIKEMGVVLDHKLATCLLTGLYTDTGGFKHPNTTSETLKFASLLLSHGARLKDITTNITQPSSVSRLKLWGIALSRIQHHPHFDLVSTYITHEDIMLVGASQDDIAGIAALLVTIPAAISVMVVHLPNQATQVRMRTKHKTINLAQLAAYLGGGGQKKAAGFSLSAGSLVLPLSQK